jgi:tetratricopeptide (TPR) repeat protein
LPARLMAHFRPAGFKPRSCAIVLCLVATAAAPHSIAAPVASPEGTGSGSSVAAVLCERKYVYSQTQRSCVEANSALINDGERYEQGRALALAGHYAQALDALESVTRKAAPSLTMIGYAKRKLGRFDEGIAAYQEALAIDPNSAEAREYLGEAYVETDRFDLARIELDRIAAICGNRTCEQYVDLAEAINEASP